MKITQSKDYKKPLYAIGIAAALVATSVTGCGSIFGDSGNGPVTKGGSGTRTMSSEYSKYNADDPVIEEGEIAIAGEIDEPDVELDGDVVLAGEETVDDCNLLTEGGAPVDTGD